MLLINFAHPITPSQREQVEALVGITPGGGAELEIRDCPAHFDMESPFMQQARALADAARLSAEEWQSAALIVNLPSHSAVAATLLAELHGRMGRFPTILRLKPRPGPVTVFAVTEVINLQSAREEARSRRFDSGAGER